MQQAKTNAKVNIALISTVRKDWQMGDYLSFSFPSYWGGWISHQYSCEPSDFHLVINAKSTDLENVRTSLDVLCCGLRLC